jgi:HK97 family phage major capsid protein
MSMQAVRERISAARKEAANLMADKPKDGAPWTVENQTRFDALMDTVERDERNLGRLQADMDADADRNFKDAARNHPGHKPGEETPIKKVMDTWFRKSAAQMSRDEALAIYNTTSTTTGSEGGYTVQPQVAREWIDLLKAYSFMRKVADSIVTETGVDLSYPTSDGTSEVGEIVAQNASASAVDPVFSTRALNTFKFGSKVIAIPLELLQDSQIDVQAMVYKRARDRIGRIQNQKFSIGTGTGEPFGLAAVASTGKTGLTGQTLTIIYDDLVDMVDSLDAAYLDNPPTAQDMPGLAPGWMFSQTLRRVIRKIKDTQGRPIWTPSWDGGFQVGTPDTLLGYPVYINNDMPVPAANAKSLAFGNLRRYMIRDAMSLTLFRFDDSPYLSKGQVGFLAWARAGGNLMDINSVKLYQHSAT